MFPTFQSDFGRRQESVYGRDGGFIGTVVYDSIKQGWQAFGDKGLVGPFPSREEAERYLRRAAKQSAAPNTPQGAPQRYVGPHPGSMDTGELIGAVLAGAALLGALSGFFADEQPGRSQQSDLAQQNELLRQQNELLKQALAGQQASPGTIVKR